MNLLLDTNVVIDYLGRKEPFFPAAQKIIAAGYFRDATLYAPVQSLKDAYFVLSHHIDQVRVQRAIVKLAEVVTFVAPTGDDAVRAARLEWPDYEDCLVALCAEKARADYLLTRDVKGFDRSPVPVMTPEDWLQMMHDAQSIEYHEVGLGEPAASTEDR